MAIDLQSPYHSQVEQKQVQCWRCGCHTAYVVMGNGGDGEVKCYQCRELLVHAGRVLPTPGLAGPIGRSGPQCAIGQRGYGAKYMLCVCGCTWDAACQRECPDCALHRDLKALRSWQADNAPNKLLLLCS